MRFLSQIKKEQSDNSSQNDLDSVQVMVGPSTSYDESSEQKPNEQNVNSSNSFSVVSTIEQNSVKSNVDQVQRFANNQQKNVQQINSEEQTCSADQQNAHLKSKNNTPDEMTHLLVKQERVVQDLSTMKSKVDDDDTVNDVEDDAEISHKSILKELVKHFFFAFIALLITYSFGYFNLSFAWILIVLVIGFVAFASKLRTKHRLLANKQLDNEQKYIERVLVDLPNWVLFPDHERVEFLNKSLKQMWPYLNLYIQKFLKETLLPEILTNLPDYLKGIRFEKIDLGTTPLRIGSIKCHTERSSKMEILLDLQIIYSGNANFKLSFFKFAAGVKDLQLFGMLRVRLYPLTEHPPFSGSVSFTFLNCPKFDFNLTNLANILDLPVLNNLLRNAVLEQLASHIVYPNVQVIPLSDIPMRVLKFNQPDGVLRLEIIEAKDLLKADYGLLGMGKSDPYCRIIVSTFNLQTQVIPNTVNPQFGFITEIAMFEDQEIMIEVYDKDQNTADDFLGRKTLRLDEYDCTGEKSHWINLDETTTGRIHVRLTWLKLSSDLSKLETQIKHIERIKLIYSNSMLNLMQSQQKSNIPSELTELSFGSAFCCMVYLDCIRYLPKVNQLEPSVYVEVILGMRRRRSIIVESNCDPVFEQNFLFLCDQFNQEPPLCFEIHDAKSKKKIGQTALKLENLVSGGRLSFDKPIHVRINQSLDCVLKVAIELRVLYQSGFKGRKATNLHKDTFEQSDTELDQEDKNIIIDEPPQKDNIPSLDRMVMSTVEPFLMVYNKLEENSEPKSEEQVTKKDMPLQRSSARSNSVRKVNGSIRESKRIHNSAGKRTETQGLRNESIASSSLKMQKPQINLSFENLHDPNYGPIKVTVLSVVNLPGLVTPNTFYFVKIRRFPLRSKKQIHTQKVFNTNSPVFSESFNLINPKSHPLTQLEIRLFRGKVCSTFKIFQISKQITRVIVDLTRIDETRLTKYFDLDEIQKIVK